MFYTYDTFYYCILYYPFYQVCQASLQALSDCFKKAAQKVRSYCMMKDAALNNDSVIDIAISYDGTWHRRGHSSHHGVGTAIHIETGLVLDVEVLSNYCKSCKSAPDVNDPAYNAWLENHKSTCQKNYSGSSGAMEVEAAKRICQRSVDKYNLRYTTILCDGDAKTVTTLNNAGIYNTVIHKEDCVNHVAKRLYNGIESAKLASRGTKDHLAGKGRITKKLQKRLFVSYGQALKNGAPDVSEMKREVMATLHHRMSSDAKPQHQYCPVGADSWCKYQKESASGILDEDRKYVHKMPIKPEYGMQLLPLYECLSKPGI